MLILYTIKFSPSLKVGKVKSEVTGVGLTMTSLKVNLNNVLEERVADVGLKPAFMCFHCFGN